jgi:Fe-S cluster assembly scaffold protein SufB
MIPQKILPYLGNKQCSRKELHIRVSKQEPCALYLDQLSGINDHIEKIIIYLEQGAQATIYDVRACKGTSSVEISLADDAKLSYVYDRHEQIIHANTSLDISLHKKSFFQSMITITSGDVQFYLTLHLLELEAVAHVGGFFHVQNRSRCEIKTMQHHAKGFNISSVLLYGVVTDDASVDYHGLIAIKPEAVRSNAEQVNKTILIGQHARSKSVPSLEVQTNDVQCKHGAAMGQFDDEQLFYLQARGLLYEQAQKLLLRAFLSQAGAHVSEEMQTQLHNKIDSLFIK